MLNIRKKFYKNFLLYWVGIIVKIFCLSFFLFGAVSYGVSTTSLQYTYNDNGTISIISDGNGTVLYEFVYDAKGQLTSIIEK
jgi:hypothetical protein